MICILSFRLLSGEINWGRIVALLCFGYRLSLALAHDIYHNIVPNIAQLVVRFMIRERMLNWIYDHGGWVCFLYFQHIM